MTRIEAIARLRELADKLEAATDALCDEHSGFDVDVRIHDNWIGGDEHRDAMVDYWLSKLGHEERCEGNGFCVYRNRSACVAIFRGDTKHQPPADLLANREVQFVPVEGGAA